MNNCNFRTVTNKVVKRFMDAFFIKQNNVLRKIPFASVLWIQADGNYSIVHSDNNKRYVLRISLKQVLDQLPEDVFLRIHRAYAVPLDKIEDIYISSSELLIADKKLPIGRNYRANLMEHLNIVK